MSKRFFAGAFGIGLACVGWVGVGFVGSSWLALAITGVIGGVYLLGALELRQFRATNAALAAALADIPQPLPALGDWLQRVPAALRHAVRLRVEGERGGLPAPALTPYLVGLLVMLGMLGTFLGMVLTFKGAVFALEGSADLQAMRSALAEPIKGLGLSFGTSVAGVAASAMLGLMSAICRRERLDLARELDSRIATVLRPFSYAQQRTEAFGALQAQAAALPQVFQKLEALLERIDQRSEQLDAQLLQRQAVFQREATQAYSALAQSVGTSLQESLAAGARAAGESITPVVESAMTRIVQDAQRWQAGLRQDAQAQADLLSRQFSATTQAVTQTWQAALARHEELVRSRIASEATWAAQQRERMDQLAGVWRTQLEALRQDEARRGEAAVERLGELQSAVTQHLATLGAALEAPLGRLLQTASEVPQAAAAIHAQLRRELSRLAEQDNAALQERTVLLAQVGTLLQDVNRASGEQRAAIEGLVSSASTALQQAGGRFAEALATHGGQAAEMSVHATASAVELASLGEAFAHGVQLFQGTSEKLLEGLQRVEQSINRSTARSDEQLAYYVAQAREVIDLSIASQHGLVENLRQFQAKPSAAPAGALA